MKAITTIMLGILLISCASAINITAGESYNLTLSEEYVYYEVTGNQTNVDLNITQDGTDVTIIFGKYIDDTLTITFYNWKDEVIEQQQGGGGSSYTKKVIVNETKEEVEENIDEIIEEEIIEEEVITDSDPNTFLKIMVWIFLIVAIFVVLYLVFKKEGVDKK